MPRACNPAEPCTAPAETELTPIETFAVRKAVKDAQLDKLRPRLKLGDGQQVDFTVRIRGAVNVAGNATETKTESVKPDQVLACVLSHVSARARKTLLEQVKGDFAVYRANGGAPKLADDLVDLADDLLKSATREVNAPKKGAVSGALELKLVKRHG
jgi:hypothetical protein